MRPLLAIIAAAIPTALLAADPPTPGALPVATDADAWKVIHRKNPPLPVWARTLAGPLPKTTAAMLRLAERNTGTIVPNYTNGVAAQPNSYGHYLLGHAAGLDRDAQRIREAYARIDRSPMGTTVLNGTSWPLDRTRMAGYLGFATTVDNAYDAAQISAVNNFIDSGYDAVIIDAQNPTAFR